MTELEQKQLLTDWSGCHVVIIGRCPDEPDKVLFRSSDAKESQAICHTAFELLCKRVVPCA